MALDTYLVNAAFDALGISPEARAREQQRADEDYERVVKGFESGLSAREQGLDPKTFEDRFGPYRAAQLIGAEKTQAFQQAAQQRATAIQMRQAIEQALAAPVDAGPYSGFEGPSFEGGRAPGPGDYAERISTITSQPGGSELLTTYFGAEPLTRGLAREQFGFDVGPRFELDQRGMAVNEGNLAVNQGNLGARQAELEESARQFDNRMVADIDATNRNRVATLTQTVMSWNPLLDARAARTIARVHAGELNPMVLAKRKTADGRRLDEVVGVLSKSAGGSGLPLSTLYTRRDAIRDRVPNYIKGLSKNRKSQSAVDPAQLDSENTGALIQAIENAIEIATLERGASGTPIDLDEIITEVLYNASFARSDGGRTRAVPYTALTGEEQQVRRMQVERFIADRYGARTGASSGVSPAGEAVFGAWTGSGGGAPTAAPTAAPTPATGPTGGLVPRGMAIPPGMSAPVVAPTPTAGAVPAGFGTGFGPSVPGQFQKPLRR